MTNLNSKLAEQFTQNHQTVVRQIYYYAILAINPPQNFTETLVKMCFPQLFYLLCLTTTRLLFVQYNQI